MRLNKANNRAFWDLVLTFHGDICFDLVDEIIMGYLPAGSLNLALKKLKNRLNLKDGSDEVKLKEQCMNSIDWKQHPEYWIILS